MPFADILLMITVVKEDRDETGTARGRVAHRGGIGEVG